VTITEPTHEEPIYVIHANQIPGIISEKDVQNRAEHSSLPEGNIEPKADFATDEMGSTLPKYKLLNTIDKLEQRFGSSRIRARVSRYSSLSRFAGLISATLRLTTFGCLEFVIVLEERSPSLARIMLDSTQRVHLIPIDIVINRYVKWFHIVVTLLKN
jgi:hypothetical protein